MWGRKTNNHHLFSFFFFFFPTFLNKAKIHQPNRNWQHSFKKQNKARPSWALTRLLYLFVSHMLGPCAIQLPLLWAGFLCSAFPSPPGTLKLFLWFLLCVEHSWSKPPGAAQTPVLAPAPNSDKAQVYPCPRTPELEVEAGNWYSPFHKCILEKTLGPIDVSPINRSLLWLA